MFRRSSRLVGENKKVRVAYRLPYHVRYRVAGQCDEFQCAAAPLNNLFRELLKNNSQLEAAKAEAKTFELVNQRLIGNEACQKQLHQAQSDLKNGKERQQKCQQDLQKSQGVCLAKQRDTYWAAWYFIKKWFDSKLAPFVFDLIQQLHQLTLTDPKTPDEKGYEAVSVRWASALSKGNIENRFRTVVLEEYINQIRAYLLNTKGVPSDAKDPCFSLDRREYVRNAFVDSCTLKPGCKSLQELLNDPGKIKENMKQNASDFLGTGIGLFKIIERLTAPLSKGWTSGDVQKYSVNLQKYANLFPQTWKDSFGQWMYEFAAIELKDRLEEVRKLLEDAGPDTESVSEHPLIAFDRRKN